MITHIIEEHHLTFTDLGLPKGILYHACHPSAFGTSEPYWTLGGIEVSGPESVEQLVVKKLGDSAKLLRKVFDPVGTPTVIYQRGVFDTRSPYNAVIATIRRKIGGEA